MNQNSSVITVKATAKEDDSTMVRQPMPTIPTTTTTTTTTTPTMTPTLLPWREGGETTTTKMTGIGSESQC